MIQNSETVRLVHIALLSQLLKLDYSVMKLLKEIVKFTNHQPDSDCFSWCTPATTEVGTGKVPLYFCYGRAVTEVIDKNGGNSAQRISFQGGTICQNLQHFSIEQF